MKTPNWSRDVQKDDKQMSDTGQLHGDDKFEALWKKRKVDPARVSVSVSEGMDYGAAKVSATVTVNCDQDEATINKAGELSFYKALELVRDGWGILGGK